MTQEITSEIVRELLKYDPEAGVFTYRNRDRKWFRSCRQYKTWNTRFSGKRAGYTKSGHGGSYTYRQIGLLGRGFLEHRLAWMWMTDEAVPSQIDHENRDATDNRWSNLRASTHVHNQHNMSMPRTNTSGVAGVVWSKGAWQAQGKVNSKYHYLGRFQEIDEAAMEVLEFRSDHGFDPHHGLEMAHYHKRIQS